MPDIAGAFKHQLINQQFFCTEMEYVSINPTDLREFFPAAWTYEHYVSHILFINCYFSVLFACFFFYPSFFLRFDLVWKEETGTMGGSILTWVF